MNEYDVIVVGAGPAGMMAAGQASLQGCSTLLIEKMGSPGRKLLLTGKGRCNLSNTAPIKETLNHFNEEGRFLKNAFYRFYNTELVEFFESLNVPTVVQRGGRIFPVTENSKDVLASLLNWTTKSGVELMTETSVTELIVDAGKIQGIKTSRGIYHAPKLILASGGKSYPGTGSTGDGYALARLAGHVIHPLRPALVPLITASRTARQLQGLSLKNISLSVWVNNKKIDQLFGELLFTHFGLSGPVVLSLSRQIVIELEQNNPVEVIIDLKPALDFPALNSRLLRDIQKLGKKQFSSLLEGLLPKKLISVCLDQVGIPRDMKISQISSAERNQLLSWLKVDFKFTVTGHKGFDQAIITAGGVDTSEIETRTMESKITSGLYFAGEIINIDADTGGYNLQAAFSTGWAAGKAAGEG